MPDKTMRSRARNFISLANVQEVAGEALSPSSCSRFVFGRRGACPREDSVDLDWVRASYHLNQSSNLLSKCLTGKLFE